MSSEETTNRERIGRMKDMGRDSRLSFRNIAERELRTELKEEAWVKCNDQVKTFASCAQEKGLMVVFSCRSLYKELAKCMNEHNGEEAWQRYKEANKDRLEKRSRGESS